MVARKQKPETEKPRKDGATPAVSFKPMPQPDPDWTALHQETAVQFEKTLAYLAK